MVESPVHSGQPLGEGAREGQVEDEHGTGGLGGVGVGAVQALRSQLRGERDRAMGVQGGRSGARPQDRRGRGRGWT